jgi:hypothetical protein
MIEPYGDPLYWKTGKPIAAQISIDACASEMVYGIEAVTAAGFRYHWMG